MRFGATAARVEVDIEADDGAAHARGRLRAGRAEAVRSTARRWSAADTPARPLVGVFLPDRLELVKGAPALAARTWTSSSPRCGRRAAGHAGAYARALAQRNALLGRVRAGARRRAGRSTPGTRELAAHGHRADGRPRRGGGARSRAGSPQRAARARPAGRRGARATGRARRPPTPTELDAELRGAPRRGPRPRLHRARAAPRRPRAAARRPARCARYGSQGQQRLGLLALLFAERDVLPSSAAARR